MATTQPYDELGQRRKALDAQLGSGSQTVGHYGIPDEVREPFRPVGTPGQSGQYGGINPQPPQPPPSEPVSKGPQGATASPRDTALQQVSQVYTQASAAPQAPAAAPGVDLNNLWNDYQQGRIGADKIRDFTSMDDMVVYDSQGRPSTDPNFQDGESTDAAGYRDPWVEAFINAGLGNEADRAALTAERVRTGGLLYQPGQKRTFAQDSPVNSYDVNDPTKRAEATQASDLGHALPDSTDLSRAGWQNVTQAMREQFRDQGFIPQAPPSEAYAQSGNPLPPSFQPPANPGPFQPPTSTGPTGPGVPVSTEPVASQPSQMRSELNRILMEQLGQLSGDVSADDPGIAPLLAQQRLSSQREADRARAVAAERRAAQGLGDSGAMETDIRGIDEARAERNLSNESNVLYNELGNRRSTLQNLLGTAVSADDAEATRGLTERLTTIDQQMRDRQFGQSLGENARQFNVSQEQRGKEFAEQMGLNWAQLSQQDKQYYAGLAQQQGQFNDQLGFNWAGLEQQGNLQALMALLGAA